MAFLNGATALFIATMSAESKSEAHEQVFKVFLEDERVNPNIPTIVNAYTPINIAAQLKNESGRDVSWLLIISNQKTPNSFLNSGGCIVVNVPFPKLEF